MILRNLSTPNRTQTVPGFRLTIFKKNIIEAAIFTGFGRRETIFTPRVTLILSDYHFLFRRLHFPAIDVAMTINKHQGQSLNMAGVELREDCFFHDQWCVACSRVDSSNNLVTCSYRNERIT